MIKQIVFCCLLLLLMMILVGIILLLCVAFLTLMERKVLGFIQIRKGPNKLGMAGILQPFSDAIKLLFKEDYIMLKLNYLYYYITPVLSLMLILMMWMIYPYFTNMLMMNLGMIYLMCCLGLNSYMMLILGWSSSSIYSMLGSMRSLAQSISYEVSLAIILISSILLIDSFNINKLINFQFNSWMLIYMWPISLMFLFSMMAELNRTPFDFSEGESELVSGFNVEYGGSGFILIFLSEYASIMFMSLMFSLLYMGGDYIKIYFYVKILSLVFLIIWVRGSLPRFRYDLLMYLCWLMILPFSLNYLFYMMMFKWLV